MGDDGADLVGTNPMKEAREDLEKAFRKLVEIGLLDEEDREDWHSWFTPSVPRPSRN